MDPDLYRRMRDCYWDLEPVAIWEQIDHLPPKPLRSRLTTSWIEAPDT